MNRGLDIGLLIVRLVLGITFAIHGFDKFQGGIGNTAMWFDSIGIPQFMTYVVAIIELVGGALMILGLGTRVIGALFAIVMVVAIFKVKLALGFMGNGQMAGYELDLALMAMSALLALGGSRLLSLEGMLFNSSESQE
jgi:putative oxidoreductase